MDKTRKLKLIAAAVLSWLTMVSCKIPNIMPDLGGALDNIFKGIGDSIKF